MKRSQISFYATREDTLEVLEALESQVPVSFVRAGTSTSPDFESWDVAKNIARLGTAQQGDQAQEPWLLIVPRETEVKALPIPQSKGGVRYAIDQRLNPNSVAFKAGGVYQNDCLIAGQLGTCSDGSFSKQVLEILSREVRNRFTRIKSYYVGKHAAALLDRGFRLTTDIRSPLQFDLAR